MSGPFTDLLPLELSRTRLRGEMRASISDAIDRKEVTEVQATRSTTGRSHDSFN